MEHIRDHISGKTESILVALWASAGVLAGVNPFFDTFLSVEKEIAKSVINTR